MKENFNILITGCQGDIGISMYKCIKAEWPNSIFHGCDLIETGPGEVFFKEISKVPPANSATYIESLLSIVSSQRIDFIIPGSEPELKYFHRNPIAAAKFGNKLIWANDLSMTIGFDKLKTQNHLKKHELTYLESHDARDLPAGIEYPCILKPRSESGSRGLKVIKEKKELGILEFLDGDFILQKYLSSPKEYTSCVFSDGSNYRTITLDRVLRYGLSVIAFPVFDKEIDQYLIKVAKTLNLKGSINIQFKMDENKKIYIFEINPRFSSTVHYRHLIGFKDLIWSIETAAGLTSNLNQGIKNKRLIRYFEDVIV